MAEVVEKTVDPFERLSRDSKKHGLVFEIDGIYDFKEGPIRVGQDLCSGQPSLCVGDVSLIAKNNGENIKFSTCCLKREICVGEDYIVGQQDPCKDDPDEDDPLRVADYVNDPTVKTLVMLEGSTKQINQSLRLFEGGVNSIQTATVELLDENGFLSKIFKPGFLVEDIIGRCGDLKFTVDCKDYPEVTKTIIRGPIVEIQFRPCSIILTIQAPQTQLDTEVNINPFSAKLTTPINLLETNLVFKEADQVNLNFPRDTFESYLQVGGDENTEIMGPILNFDLTTIEIERRGLFNFGTFTHAEDEDIKALYKLEDNIIDAVLKLMISTSNQASPYNIFPFGAGIDPEFIDVEKFEEIKDLFFVSNPDLCIWFKDGENLKDLIERKLLAPHGLTLANKGDGTITLIKLAPAVFKEEQLELNACNLTSPDRISWTRSNKNYYYSSVSFFYDFNPITCTPNEASIKVSGDAINRFRKSGYRTLELDSRGVKAEDNSVILSEACKYLDRFEFGAKFFRGVEVPLNIGLCLDVGSVVRLNTDCLNISSDKRGDREGEEILLEVVSKNVSVLNNKARIDLLSTGFDTRARFGLIAPSSKIDEASSTTTKLSLIPSFSSTTSSDEIDKWCECVGERIKIIDDCGVTIHEATITAVDQSGVTIDPAVMAPLSECQYLEPIDFVCDGVESKWEKEFVHLQECLTLIGATSTNNPIIDIEDVGCAFPVPEPSESPCFDVDPTPSKRPAFIQKANSCESSEEFFICNIQNGAIIPDREINITIEAGDKLIIGGIESNDAYRMF